MPHSPHNLLTTWLPAAWLLAAACTMAPYCCASEQPASGDKQPTGGSPAPVGEVAQVTSAEQLLAESLASIVREAVPREYEKKKNWGHTKRITTGVTSDGPLYKMKLHRRKTYVNHGTWKHYRVWFTPDEVEIPGEKAPENKSTEKNLRVAVENLHSLEAGGVGLRLVVDAELEGWAQMRHYNRGIHVITLTAEGVSQLRLTLDCEVRLKMTATGMAIDPKVTKATLDLRDFDLTRFGEIEGKLAHELGRGMRSVVEDQLDSPRLTAKLNRAIDKKRDRLVLSSAKLWGGEP